MSDAILLFTGPMVVLWDLWEGVHDASRRGAIVSYACALVIACLWFWFLRSYGKRRYREGREAQLDRALAYFAPAPKAPPTKIESGAAPREEKRE